MLPLRGASYLLQKKCYAGWNMGLRGHTDTGYYLGCRWLIKLDPCQKMDVAKFRVCIIILFSLTDHYWPLRGLWKRELLQWSNPVSDFRHTQYGRAVIEVIGEWCALLSGSCKLFLQQMLWRDMRFHSVTNWLKSLFRICDELILYFGSQVLASNA